MIIAILHNLKTNRYHPILFRDAPTPSHKDGEFPIRMKSFGHHTEGFNTRCEAIADCKKMAEKEGMELYIEKDFVWDGEGVPARILFKNSEGKIAGL